MQYIYERNISSFCTCSDHHIGIGVLCLQTKRDTPAQPHSYVITRTWAEAFTTWWPTQVHRNDITWGTTGQSWKHSCSNPLSPFSHWMPELHHIRELLEAGQSPAHAACFSRLPSAEQKPVHILLRLVMSRSVFLLQCPAGWRSLHCNTQLCRMLQLLACLRVSLVTWCYSHNYFQRFRWPAVCDIMVHPLGKSSQWRTAFFPGVSDYCLVISDCCMQRLTVHGFRCLNLETDLIEKWVKATWCLFGYQSHERWARTHIGLISRLWFILILTPDCPSVSWQGAELGGGT
jgi:hypothetical protein